MADRGQCGAGCADTRIGEDILCDSNSSAYPTNLNLGRMDILRACSELAGRMTAFYSLCTGMGASVASLPFPQIINASDRQDLFQFDTD